MRNVRYIVLVLCLIQCAGSSDSFRYHEISEYLIPSVLSERPVYVQSNTITDGHAGNIVITGTGEFRTRCTIPPSSQLLFEAGRPQTLELPARHDVTVCMAIRTRGISPDTLWMKHIDSGSRGVAPEIIDLDRFEGLNVEFIFSASGAPDDNSPHSWTVWRNVHIRSAERPRALGNILLITLDAVRADFLGCYGDTAAHTPNLDNLAALGTLFSNAYSNFNVTNPSLATMFTGLYGRDHGVYDLSTPLPSQFRTMAEILNERGYATGAIVGVHHLASEFSGLDQGFDDYFAPSAGEWKANEITDRAGDWIAQHRTEPFFLWIHYFDPHMLYDPPDSFAQSFCPEGPALPGHESLADSLADYDLVHLGPVGISWLRGISNPEYPRAMYRAEIAFTDMEIGRLLRHVKSLFLESKTLVAITSDHGESLHEHGIFFNHIGLYDQQIRIPFILHCPGLIPGEKRIPDFIAAVDFAPTLLDFVAASLPIENGGVSFSPSILYDKPGARSFIIAQHADNRAATLRTSSWKLIHSWLPYSVVGVDTLFFDIEEDPGETLDISFKDIRATRALAELTNWRSRGRGVSAASVALDESTRNQLIALGYIPRGEQ